MKNLVLIAMVAVAAGSAASSWAQTQASAAKAATQPAAKAHILTRAEFDELLAKPDQLLVLDVRRPDELTSIGGFPAYLSVQSGDVEKYLAFIPNDRTIVTVSNHAGRAARAADLLASKGFNVAGAVGAQDYEAQGGKLTKIAPKKPTLAAQAKS